MAKHKKIAAQPAKTGGKQRKQKEGTQKPKMQRIKVMGPSGKLRLEWREW